MLAQHTPKPGLQAPVLSRFHLKPARQVCRWTMMFTILSVMVIVIIVVVSSIVIIITMVMSQWTSWPLYRTSPAEATSIPMTPKPCFFVVMPGKYGLILFSNLLFFQGLALQVNLILKSGMNQSTLNASAKAMVVRDPCTWSQTHTHTQNSPKTLTATWPMLAPTRQY